MTRTKAFFNGAGIILTLPGLVLLGAMAGFAGFALETGLSRNTAVLMAGLIFALPSQFILIGSILAGTSLPITFLAVTLSAIRLMPMSAAIIPEIRGSRTPTWFLLVLSHFVAITPWVYSIDKVRSLPRHTRVSFFAGAGGSVWLVSTLVVGISYDIIVYLPLFIFGTLFFLTPIYFLMATWRSARDYTIYIAMGLGLVLGPVFSQVIPEIDILLAGTVGGSLATLIYLLVEKRRANNT